MTRSTLVSIGGSLAALAASAVVTLMAGCGSGAGNIVYEARTPDGAPRDARAIGVAEIDCPDPLSDPAQCTAGGAPFTGNVKGAFRVPEKAFAHWANYRERVISLAAKHGCDGVAMRRLPPNAPRNSQPIGAFCVDLGGAAAVQGAAAPAPLRPPMGGSSICSGDRDCSPPGHCVHGMCQ